MKFSQIRLWATVAALTILSACGGGGGGSSSPATSTETFQLRTAYVSYITDSRSLPFTLTGVASGINVTGSGTVTQGSLSSSTFEGQPALAKTTSMTGSFTGNGQTVSLANSVVSYVDSNYNPLGFSGSEYEVVSSLTSIPATARVNDTGVLYSSIRYTTSSKTVRNGTATATFVLEPDTSNTALLKIIEIERNGSGTTTSTSTTTFRMTPAGALTRLSESVVEGSSSLNISY